MPHQYENAYDQRFIATCPKCAGRVDDRTFTCTNCGKGKIWAHFPYQHGGASGYGCNHCGSAFSDGVYTALGVALGFRCPSCAATITNQCVNRQGVSRHAVRNFLAFLVAIAVIVAIILITWYNEFGQRARHFGARDNFIRHSISETTTEMKARADTNAKAGIHDPVDDLFRSYDGMPVYTADSCDFRSRTKDIVRVPGDVATRFDWMAIRASRNIPFCQEITLKGVSGRRFINRGGMDYLARRYQDLKEHGAF
jgi:hypothetical protein